MILLEMNELEIRFNRLLNSYVESKENKYMVKNLDVEENKKNEDCIFENEEVIAL